MAVSPAIETDRLRIVSFSVTEHLTPRYVGWLNDPEVTRFSEQANRVHTLQTCREYAESYRDTPHHFWAVVTRDDRLGHIGNMNAVVNPGHGVADLGILIGERLAQGQGYATEAWTAVCDYLLRTAGIRKVTAGTLASNAPMLRLMERSGMSADGRRLRHHVWRDQVVDVVHAALFREEWLRRHPTPASVTRSRA